MGHRYNKNTVIKESEIENYFVRKIEAIGGRAIKFNPHNNRGLPDRVCFLPGGHIFLVELKRPGMRPRKNQERQLALFRKLGFQATWADSFSRVDKLIELIKSHIREHRNGFHVERLCYRRECPMRRDR